MRALITGANSHVNKVLLQKLIDLGFDPVAGSGADLAAIIDRDLRIWRDVVQKSGAKVE